MTVRQIWRYPVKSAQGESVDRATVTGLGLEWDRRLAIVDVSTGRPLTGRREPKLLMLSANVSDGGVLIRDPDGHALASDADLSAWLGRSVRLALPPVDPPPEYDFPVDFEDESGAWDVWTGPTGVWHDSTRTQVSILSVASLRDWPVRRFRPNVVVEGVDENALVGRRVAIGSAAFDVMKRIDRCVMVTRPQPGGIERDLSVLKTVIRESDGFLGVGALVADVGEFEVGDQLRDLGPSPKRINRSPGLLLINDNDVKHERRRDDCNQHDHDHDDGGGRRP